MSYFKDENVTEDVRRNHAFKLLCGLREALSVARRSQQMVPYRKAMALIKDVDEELFKEVKQLVTKTNEHELVKYYRQRAFFTSKENNSEVLPQELVQEDIDINQKLLEQNNEGDDASMITKRIIELEAILEFFNPEDISENSLLNHDFNTLKRFDFFEQKLYEDEKLQDYSLDNNRVLRMRLLHPDKGERVTGTDMVYEQFDLINNRVRFVHLQYKTWNTNTLYFSQGNVSDQIKKLDGNLCQSGYCSNYSNGKYPEGFRFPYCAAFLRPTSNLTRPDANLFSTGDHIPICMVKKIQEEDVKLTNKNIVGRTLSHKLFSDLFIDNLLGSKWISLDKLQEFYEEKGINSYVGKIRVHAQEVNFETEADIARRSEN